MNRNIIFLLLSKETKMSIELVGLNSRCPHCYKIYISKDGDWNYCPKGHRTLVLNSIKRQDIQNNLILDYKMWIKFYKEHHHWIKRIFSNRRKLFVKVLKRDQKNIFQLYPLEMDDMIKKAIEIGDLERDNDKDSKK